MKINIILIVLLVLASCKGKDSEIISQEDITDSIGVISDISTPIDTLEFLRNFRTQQLGERKFVLQPGDTVEFGKPVLKLFTGQVEGKAVQFWLASSLLNNFQWGYEITTWTDSGKYIRQCNLYKTDADRYTGKILKYENEINEAQDTLLYSIQLKIVQDKDHLQVLYKNKILELKESDFRFTAYDKFVYQNILCEKYKELYSEWSYFFDFSLDTQTISAKNNSLSKISSYFDPKQNWQDTINTDLLINSSYCDEPIGLLYEKNFTQPLYIDSLLFIAINFIDAWVGGAHSMTYTHYSNYDLQTGDKLDLGDILDLNSAAYKNFYNKLVDRDSYEGYYVSEEVIEQQITPTSFYILPNGIALQYGGYKLMGGFWEKRKFLPYNEIKPFLKTHKYFHSF